MPEEPKPGPKIKQTGVIFSPELTVTFAANFFMWAAIIFAIVVIGFAGILLAKKNTKRSLDQKISQIDQELIPLKSLDEEVIAFDEAVSNIQSALSQKQKYSVVFNELNKITPQDIALSSFSLDEKGQVKIDGYAPSLTSIARLILALRGDKDNPQRPNSQFKDVNLTSTSIAQNKINFSLSLSLMR